MRSASAALAALAFACCHPALAQAAGPAPRGDLRRGLDSLQTDDARLLTIGWRLARANVAYCAETAPSLGLQLLDVQSFARPADVRAALNLSGDFAVEAVATDSPAATAGLRAGDNLLSIDDAALIDQPPVAPGSYQRLAAVQARIDRARTLRVVTAGAAARTITVAPVSTCRSRFELLTSGSGASADGDRVTIARRLLALAQNDDEAAFLIAHEFAHNVLRHSAWLARVGKSSANVKATERSADRLALWLMANAGYDPTQAPVFMERWGRRKSGPLYFSTTHDHWKTRVALIGTELSEIDAPRAVSESASLDWRTKFPR